MTKPIKFRFILPILVTFLVTWGSSGLINTCNFKEDYSKLAISVVKILAAIFIFPICFKLRIKEIKNFGLGCSKQSAFEISSGILISFLFMLSFFLDKVKENTIIFLIVNLLTCIFTAIGEELIFRGYALQMMEKDCEFVSALIFTSLAFGFMHIINPDRSYTTFLETAIGGILFSFAYFKTKQIWLSIGLHFSWNFFGPPEGLFPTIFILFLFAITIACIPLLTKMIEKYLGCLLQNNPAQK